MDSGYKIFPLGDTAAAIDLGNIIDEDLNKKVIAMQRWFNSNVFEGIKDIIVAYSSLCVYYDPIITRKKNNISTTVFEFIKQKLETAFHESVVIDEDDNNIIRIPVCYSNDFGIDIGFLSKEKNISKQEIINLHISKIYRVYMIGFLPGFSYLGKVDERLMIARKPKPTPIAAGSVGIAGSQTGIYPLNSPGGWQIIGRTPVKLFDAYATLPTLLNVGNHVQFYEINKEEFENYSINKQS
jgi:inhibitor of KinA